MTPVVVLTVKKVADSDDATIGDVVTFTITVTNNGPSDATDIRLIDILDEELYWISGDLEMVIPFLASGNSANITVKAMTTANGTYMNHVNVSCAENGTVKSANASVHVYNTDLKIDKTADVSDVKVGDVVNFTITIKNHGRSNATGINISDVLDGAFEFVDANGTYAKSGSSIVWTLDKLASEDSYSVWIAVKALINGTFNNTAHVDCNEETTLKNSTSTVNVDPVVKLTVTKTVDADVIEVNGNVIFTINVTNNGPSNATGVNITDAVPEGFEFIESSSKDYDSTTGLLTVPVIKAGESYVFTVTLKAVTDGVLTNIVNVTCSENGTYVNDTVDVNVTPVVNLTVRKVADSDDATIGDVVTFTITVTNNGPSNATNIKVADIIGKEFSVIEGELNHVIAFLASGDSADIVIRMKTNTNGTLTNYVNVSCDENDTVKSANASVHVYNTDLKIDKTANVSDVKVGDLVNFTVTVKNHDLSNATNVHITDELDSAFEFIDASGSYTRNNNTVVWNVNRLAGEETVSVWIVVKALTNGTFANTAHVNCSEEETVKNSTTKVNVRPAVNLTVEKTADKATVEITGEVTFTINVTNNGPSDATCINVSDAVPTGFEFVKSNDSAYDDKTGILTIPLIKSGESYVFTITLKTIADGVLTNVVNVTCSENDTVKGSNASVNVTPVVILTVEKVADTDDATVGDVITFTITVTNNGPSNATNVRVTDVLDSGLELAGGETVIVIKFLESGDSANFTVKARTTAEGTYMNRVSVSCAENGTVKSANASVHVYNTDLKITKTTADTNVSVNDNVNFTITIKNHGKANATNIHISDVLDGAFEFVNANGTYARNGQSIVWTVDKLASEASYSVWIVAKALSNGTFTNVAHVNCSEEETVKNSSATVDVKPVVNLTVKKTADVSNVSIGHEITYTINVTNNGPSNATNVVVKDELPEGLELVEGNLTTVIDLLQSGKSYIITVKAKAVSAGNLTNIVTARCDENTEEVTSNATVVANNPQMSANKTANDKFVYSGNQTSFTIKITNDGDTVLNDIRVDENIPDGLIYDSFIGSNWTGDGKTFRYNGSLDVGESVELIIVVNTTRSGIFKNMATVGSDKTDSVDTSASVRVYTPLLAVREIANNPVAVVGESVSFTVVVTNVGDCELSGIYTVNNFPEGLIYIGYEGGSWSKLTSGLLGAEASGWTQDGNKFAYSGTLKSGESANYTLFFDTTVTGTFTPEVIASSDLTASAYSNNTTVVIAPSVKVEKTSDKDSVKVGDAVRFTITVTNNGSCDAKGVFIIENAPAALALRSYYDNVNWTIDGNRFIYNGILAPNESVKLIVTYEAVRAGNVTNVAVAGADNARDVNDTCVISITPKPVPIDADLIVIKEADRHTVKVGDLIRFTITLINNGNCDLGGLFVVEKPSRHLEFVSFEGDDWIKVGNKFIYLGTLAPTDMIELVVIFRAVSDGEATNVVIAGSNMTGNESDMVFIDIEAGHGNETPSYHKQSASRMYETGNPVMLLLLAVIAIIPIKGRKH